jgi:uncharacterized cupin superfamily protein
MNYMKSISVLGLEVKVIATTASTNGAFTLFTHDAGPNEGPPPHSHSREDEIMIPQTGEWESFDGKAWTRFEPGESRFFLRGSVHGYRNCGTTTGRIVTVATPGGLDEYFERISGVLMPQDAEKLFEISDGHGINFLMPDGSLSAERKAQATT